MGNVVASTNLVNHMLVCESKAERALCLQVSTAYMCAVVLKDMIAPYLLRRRKADVAAQLPTKTEQV